MPKPVSSCVWFLLGYPYVKTILHHKLSIYVEELNHKQESIYFKKYQSSHLTLN